MKQDLGVRKMCRLIELKTEEESLQMHNMIELSRERMERGLQVLGEVLDLFSLVAIDAWKLFFQGREWRV